MLRASQNRTCPGKAEVLVTWIWLMHAHTHTQRNTHRQNQSDSGPPCNTFQWTPKCLNEDGSDFPECNPGEAAGHCRTPSWFFRVCCHLLSQPASGGPKCDGLYVPLIPPPPQQKEITWDAQYEADIHGHAFGDVQIQGLGHFGLLPVPSPTHLINMSQSTAQSKWNTQDTPPDNIFAAINVKINDNKWPSQPHVCPPRTPNAWNFRLAGCLSSGSLPPHGSMRVSIISPQNITPIQAPKQANTHTISSPLIMKT